MNWLSTVLLLSLWLPLPELEPVDEERLANLVEERRGQVVVVNFWATWCGPCREEFPYFVDLDKRYRDSGLAVVAVSMDEEADRERAAAFLEEQGAAFVSYLRDFKDFEKFVNAIDPDWTGALPATFIYSRGGEMVFRRIGEISRAELEEQVVPLLGGGGR